MKSNLKKIVFFLFDHLAKMILFFDLILEFISPQRLHGYLRERISSQIGSIKKPVCHIAPTGKIEFNLYTPNTLCSLRHQSFSEKEPETLRWIEEFGSNGVLYDIGANIGLYTIYHALLNNSRVYSFEPSVFNLQQLAKNISINKLRDKVVIISNPLSEETGLNVFSNTSEMEGGALSAFGVNHGFDGQEISPYIEYNVLGFSLDDLIDYGIIEELPALIKIDVDGIEHLILRGAKKVLKNPFCKSVLVEVNDDYLDQSVEASSILEECGFTLREKIQSEKFTSPISPNIYNQIWVKEF